MQLAVSHLHKHLEPTHKPKLQNAKGTKLLHILELLVDNHQMQCGCGRHQTRYIHFMTEIKNTAICNGHLYL